MFYLMTDVTQSYDLLRKILSTNTCPPLRFGKRVEILNKSKIGMLKIIIIGVFEAVLPACCRQGF
ncbi:MAG: hypothetical protein Q8K98_10870 [Bacteroidota bacterium]|nr:hypothetical protein [Bacteroidota bacterium]